MTPEQMAALGVSEDLQKEPMFKDVPDVPTLFKVARDNKAALGNAIRVPGPEAAEKDRTEFNEKLKKHAPNLLEVPADPVKREEHLLGLLTPKEITEYAPPEKHGLGDAAIDALRLEAKEEGLTKRQFQARVERAVKQAKQAAETEAGMVTTLKKELGAAFEDRLLAAAAAAEKLGASPEEVAAIKEGKVPVQTAKLFLNAAKSLGTEPGDLSLSSGGKGGTLTPNEIQARMGEIYSNPAFKDKAHPQHAGLVEKLYEYNKILYPEEK